MWSIHILTVKVLDHSFKAKSNLRFLDRDFKGSYLARKIIVVDGVTAQREMSSTADDIEKL